jgi:hypothetical protein
LSHLNNNKNKKEKEWEEKGKEWRKRFRVLERHYMGEYSNFTWFNIRLGYQSPNRLFPYFGCWFQPLNKGVHPCQGWWLVWKWKCLVMAWIGDMCQNLYVHLLGLHCLKIGLEAHW